jgi:serine/threonine-protein kinase RsbW
MTTQTDQATRAYALEVPGDARSLSLVRSVVGHLSVLAGFEELQASKIEIAVDEACSNILEHGYGDVTPKPPIRVEFEVQANSFCVRIYDQGDPFDFAAHAAPTFPDHWHDGNTRGVGLFLIKECMDEVSYDKSPDQRNCLRMVKMR